MTDEKLTLGTRVKVARKLFRESRQAVWKGQMHFSKVWTPVPWMSDIEREGIIVGARTLSSGWSDYIGPDEGYAWVAEEYVNVYLVAFDLRRKPILALAEDLITIRFRVMSAAVNIGDRVEIVSIGVDVTPPEWVGRRGVLVKIEDPHSDLALTYRVRLDGDQGSTPFVATELVPEPQDSGEVR